jgi:hypothetical protein
MKTHVPTYLKRHSKEAYSYVYHALYELAPKEVQGLLRWSKEQPDFEHREVKQFIKDVNEVVEYEPTPEELKKWEFEELREKQLGVKNAQNPS